MSIIKTYRQRIAPVIARIIADGKNAGKRYRDIVGDVYASQTKDDIMNEQNDAIYSDEARKQLRQYREKTAPPKQNKLF